MPFRTSLNLTLHFSATPGRRQHPMVCINLMMEAAQNFRQQGRREFGRRGVLFLYVEVGGRLRTPLEGIFSSRLEVAYGAL